MCILSCLRIHAYTVYAHTFTHKYEPFVSTGCICKDSTNPSVNCATFKAAGTCNDPTQEKNAIFYCPLTCNKCLNITIFGCPIPSGRKRRMVDNFELLTFN